jgi:hypothetical protein
MKVHIAGMGFPGANTARGKKRVVVANRMHISGGLLSSSQMHVDLREHALCWGHGARWDTMLHVQHIHRHVYPVNVGGGVLELNSNDVD